MCWGPFGSIGKLILVQVWPHNVGVRYMPKLARQPSQPSFVQKRWVKRRKNSPVFANKARALGVPSSVT